jgi:NAD(P)-dependent dehydrogenase (short-subunit alcohol dehydrogenase family)
MKLNDKVAIVTGASQGIGKGIAIGLAKAGADVVVNYHKNVAGAESVKKEVEEIGRNKSRWRFDNEYVQDDSVFVRFKMKEKEISCLLD